MNYEEGRATSAPVTVIPEDENSQRRGREA